MYTGYGHHNDNEEAILVYYDMTFYSLYLFILISAVQGNIVSPFDTLAIHDTDTWFLVLTAFDTYMSTLFLQQQVKL